MKTPFAAILVLAALLAMLSLAVSLPAAPVAGDVGAKVASACSACHDNARVCKNLGIKDKDAWANTVARMVAKGAALDAAQTQAAIDYLAGLAPGTGSVCAQ